MKTQKQRGAKAPARERTRVNLALDAEASRRLFITSVMSGQSAGDIVTALIQEHLRTWSMPANLAARAVNSHRQSEAGPASVSDDQHAQASAA